MLRLLVPIAAVVATLAADGFAAPRQRQPARRACGKIPAQGCCNGEVLQWCAHGRLKTLDCRGRPSCGWQPGGRYDCNTGGNPDPSGTYAKHCPSEGATKPPAKAKGETRQSSPKAAATGRRVPAGDCGALGTEGCCDGSQLRYCEAGKLRIIDCSRNPSCGWRGVGQLYNCGTEGKADPRNKHPRGCPAIERDPPRRPRRPHFTGESRPTSAASGPSAGSPPRGAAGASPAGSSCALAPEPRPTPATLLALLAASILAARRRRSPSFTGRSGRSEPATWQAKPKP